MTSLIRRHPIVSFFVLAYAGSWLCWLPLLLGQGGVGLLPYDLSRPAVMVINVLALFAGPFLAGVVTTRVCEGPGSLRRFFGRFIQWREAGWTYLVALVAIPAALVVAQVVLTRPTLTFGVPAAVQLLILYVVFLLGGALQEEPGWRGFALPRMQRHLHPTVAAVVLGLVHCFWHLPQVFTKAWDTPRDDVGQLLAYLLTVVGLSVVLAWIANGARQSVLLSILGHNGVNWALTGVVPVLAGGAANTNWPPALAMTALAVMALVVTRGRLGHRPATDDPPGVGGVSSRP